MKTLRKLFLKFLVWENLTKNQLKDAFGEFGKYAKASKIIIKKNQLNDPYAEFSLKYKVKSFKGQVRFYMSIKENKPIIALEEPIKIVFAFCVSSNGKIL